MKRASLSALPARAKPEPADLTDRLLDREAASAPLQAVAAPNADAAPPVAQASAPKPPKPARRKRPASSKALPPPDGASLEQALQQAADAALALKEAAHTAPARYELPLRYRLEALAHHVQQVAEFIRGRAGQ